MDWTNWEDREIPKEQWPIINDNPRWQVNSITRLPACDNRPGYKKLYITVKDAAGVAMSGIKVRFDTEPSQGIAYDHPNVWGLSDAKGYVTWDHLGVPTKYIVWMEDDATPLIENITTMLGYEYCRMPGTVGGWIPINRPGIYSYRIEIGLK